MSIECSAVLIGTDFCFFFRFCFFGAETLDKYWLEVDEESKEATEELVEG